MKHRLLINHWVYLWFYLYTAIIIIIITLYHHHHHHTVSSSSSSHCIIIIITIITLYHHHHHHHHTVSSLSSLHCFILFTFPFLSDLIWPYLTLPYFSLPHLIYFITYFRIILTSYSHLFLYKLVQSNKQYVSFFLILMF